MDGWSVTQLMNVCTKNLQIENRSSSRPVNAGRYIAFKHHTSFTIVAQGWGDISNSIQNPSDVTVTFSGQHQGGSRRGAEPRLARLARSWPRAAGRGICFSTLLAANFEPGLDGAGVTASANIDSESRLTLFQSFCALPSEVAALFDSNLSRLPFFGQVIDLVLLLCTGFDLEHAVLFPCHILLRDQ